MTRPFFFNFLLRHRKHALGVLKDPRRDLHQDALGFKLFPPTDRPVSFEGCQWQDMESRHSSPPVGTPARVVRPQEITRSGVSSPNNA